MKRLKILGIILALVALVSAGLIVASLHVPNVWFLELWVSFVPQWFWLSIIVSVIGFLVLVKWREKGVRRSFGLMSLITAGLAIYLGIFIYPTAWTKPSQGEIPITPVIRVAFFNKAMVNADLGLVSEGILKTNPDIIGFTEIGEDEREKIAALEEYPHFFLTKCEDCRYPNAETAIFSKYPMQDGRVLRRVEDGEPLVQAIVNHAGYSFKILAVHPYSPVSAEAYSIRNQDLSYLANLIKDQPDENLIVMGDFNTTPWSPHYRQFAEATKSKIKNAVIGRGQLFTWGAWPFLASIDHIFVSNNITISHVVVDSNYNSDHRLIYADIQP